MRQRDDIDDGTYRSKNRIEKWQNGKFVFSFDVALSLATPLGGTFLYGSLGEVPPQEV